MKQILSFTRSILNRSRLTLQNLIYTRKNKRRFRRELAEYSSMSLNENIELNPCLEDWTQSTPVEPTYFYQDSWAFERIVESKPLSHIDIGSHHKYVALLSKVVSLSMVDIRPLSCKLESINFIYGSILDIPFPSNSIESLSSLCVIEHIGLGRYGDALDPLGSIKACQELARVIKCMGSLYISVPVEDKPKTYFNAHRSFNEDQFLSLFSGFSVIDRAYIYGSEFTRKRRSIYGVACYHLIKLAI